MKSLFRRRSSSSGANRAAASLADQFGAALPGATAREIELICGAEELSMTSPERMLALIRATRYVAEHSIKGDIVECGVWRGGSMAVAARTLIDCDSNQRTLWMYDTFEGMSPPTEDDVDYLGRSADELLKTEDPADEQSVWCRAPLDGVRTVMAETGYDSGLIRFEKGKVEETLPQTRPKRIALLRLDTDWYESTRCEMEYLFPLLVPGGVLIIDDYGHWEGCRRAVDEYLASHGITMLLNRIDYTGRIGVYYPAG